MAFVLVHEHDEHVRSLLEAQLAALGHEAFPLDMDTSSWGYLEFDVAVIEPATAQGLSLAQAVRSERPYVPLVVASVLSPTDVTRALSPVAHLVKPFRLADLGWAVELSLSLRPGAAQAS